MQINSAKDLQVYQRAYELALSIFRASKKWPSEEKYSLTDQIRRSSRSVCANLREAWSKRGYEARDCGYLSLPEHKRFSTECGKVGAMLGSMLKNPDPFLKHRAPKVQ